MDLDDLLGHDAEEHRDRKYDVLRCISLEGAEGGGGYTKILKKMKLTTQVSRFDADERVQIDGLHTVAASSMPTCLSEDQHGNSSHLYALSFFE